MHNKAFTLIEITIALLVVAIGLVGILTLFPVGFDASGRAANITEATLLAQEKIEDLKREGYNGATVQAALTAAQQGVFQNMSGANLNYEYDVWAFNVTGVSDLIEVVVKVYWPSDGVVGGPRLKNVELSVYLAKYVP